MGIKQHHTEELLNITCSFYTALIQTLQRWSLEVSWKKGVLENSGGSLQLFLKLNFIGFFHEFWLEISEQHSVAASGCFHSWGKLNISSIWLFHWLYTKWHINTYDYLHIKRLQLIFPWFLFFLLNSSYDWLDLITTRRLFYIKASLKRQSFAPNLWNWLLVNYWGILFFNYEATRYAWNMTTWI